MQAKRNILIVDDNHFNLLLTSKLLVNYADEIFTAKNAEEAIDICINKLDISLILMDVQMPGMNGFETVRMIKEIENMADVPVIFVSGIYKSDEFVKQGFELGAFDYLIKPFDTKLFQNKVQVFLTLFEQHRELKHKTYELTNQKEYLSKVLSAVHSQIIVLDKIGNVVLSNCHPKNIPFSNVGLFIDKIKVELNEEIKSCFNDEHSRFKEIEIMVDKKKQVYYNCSITFLKMNFKEKDVIITLNDLTKQKNSENNYKIVNRNLKVLSEANKIIRHSSDYNELFFGFCDVLVSTGGYQSVWISKYNYENAEHISIVPISSFSNLSNFRTDLIIGKYSKTDRNPYVDSLIENKVVISKNIEIIKNIGLGDFTHDFNSFISIPIKIDKCFHGNLNIICDKSLNIDNEELSLLSDFTTLLNNAISSINEKRQKEIAEDALHIEKEELKVLLSGIEDGVISVNNEGRIVFANSSAEKLFEYGENQLVGELIYNIFVLLNSKENTKLFNPIDWIQSSSESSNLRKQIDIQTRQGVKKNISLGLSKINNSTGSFTGYVIVVSDITEKLKLETQKALSQKMESVGQLAAGIAHEINTPLQYVGDNIFFLKDTLSNFKEFIELTKKTFSNADDAAIKLKFEKILDDLDIDFLLNESPIALDKAQKGLNKVSTIVLAMKNFAHPSPKIKNLSNLNQGIEVTVIISKNEWKYVANLTMDLAHDLPFIKCNIDEINQVVLNMIINASHAVEEKYGRQNPETGLITISTNYHDDFVYIVISDNGAGIKKEFLDRIFDPFFTTKEVGKGTGQGLAIVHDIVVNKHKGEITTDSTEGVGTTFKIKLPINGD